MKVYVHYTGLAPHLCTLTLRRCTRAFCSYFSYANFCWGWIKCSTSMTVRALTRYKFLSLNLLIKFYCLYYKNSIKCYLGGTFGNKHLLLWMRTCHTINGLNFSRNFVDFVQKSVWRCATKCQLQNQLSGVLMIFYFKIWYLNLWMGQI